MYATGDSSAWVIAADVQGTGYDGERDIGVWSIEGQGFGNIQPSDPIHAVNSLARRVSSFSYTGQSLGIVGLTATDCATAALRGS